MTKQEPNPGSYYYSSSAELPRHFCRSFGLQINVSNISKPAQAGLSPMSSRHARETVHFLLA